MNPLLILLLDSRAPTGTHAHSSGMEPAIASGLVRDFDDVEQFCRGRLRTSGRVAAAFAAQACRAWPDADWADLQAEYESRLPSEALRNASRQLGGGLRRLVRSMFPGVDLPWTAGPHQPIMLGVGVALAGGTPELAAHAAALSTVSGAASAAVRLLGLDPHAVHAMLARLATDLDVPQGLCTNSAPYLDMLAEWHQTMEVRLFAS